MKRILIYLMLCTTALAITQRPPVPTDIPFEYDPNAVTADILRWFVAEPNLTFIYTASVKNRWGLHVDFVVVDYYDANTPILTERSAKVPDDEDGGWIQNFNIMVTPSKEGVHYLEMTTVDKRGISDTRTLLVLCVADDPPFIFIEDPPIITKRIKEAQRIWQVAKKMGYPITKPTKLMN